LKNIVLENNIILSKTYSVGSVYLLEMTEEMLAIIAYDKNDNPLYSQGFFYNENTKKKVMKTAKSYFKKIQDCLYQKKIELIEEIE